MSVEQDVLTEIRGLRAGLPHITGVLVASVDGLLVAHDMEGAEPDRMAAMCAAQLGLSRQLARGVSVGAFEGSVTSGTGGTVAILAAGDTAVMAVTAGADLDLACLQREVRPVATRVGRLVTRHDGFDAAEAANAPTPGTRRRR